MREPVCDLLHGPGNARNSEGAFLRTASGRIRFIYSRYTGNDWADGAAADLAEVYSDDNGDTWNDRGTVVSRGTADNIMSVSLLRLAENDVRMFHLEKHPVAGEMSSCCYPVMRRSTDDGATWSEAERTIPFDEYYVMNNDRAVQLSSGRIIIPIAHHAFRTGIAGVEALRPATVFTLFSDDGGDSWRESDTVLCPNFQAEAVHGFQEPGLIELGPGKLMLWARTDLGYQYTSVSYDDGNTWSAAVPDLNFPSPLSPMSVKRDPETGILYAVWNGTDRLLHRVLPHPRGNGRTPLAIIRSFDNGKTWELKHPVLLETDPERGYCYTAMHFTGDELLLAYCFGRNIDGDSNLQDLRIRKINLKELWKN